MSKQQGSKEEGPRSFLHFLKDLADGAAENELSDELHELGKKLVDEALSRDREVGGELTFKVKMKAAPSGMVGLAYEIKTKHPTRRTSPGVMWLTTGGNFTAENPRQAVLPGIREVKPRDEGAREVDDRGRAAAKEI